MAIANDEDCEPANDELGLPGDCGSYYPGVVYIIIYLVFSFLVIVNMYIAVILENYTQVHYFFVLLTCSCDMDLPNFRFPNSESGIRNLASEITHPKSCIRNPASEIPHPKS